ncbi:MAG: pyridoxamine 5'-phosphate oxidase family protein [Pseudomonadota bacterium]
MSETQVTDHDPSPFHHGEHLVQARLGVRDIEAWARKVVRYFLPEQHRDFHTSLPFLVIAARDRQGRPWVTLLEGPQGFVSSPDPRTLVIEALPAQGDALEASIEPGSDIGILGIELATRRRNRVNGRATDISPNGFSFHVDQAYGNCPQYIREREWKRAAGSAPGQATRGRRLSAAQQDWIGSADTFFIGSGHRGEGQSPTFGMDASHRGGDRGFVQVIDERRIRFPDYAGNNHLNTIGNLVVDPRAGFLFVDFESGSLLQLSGKTSIDWESDELARFPGARRLVTLEIDEIVEIPSAVSLRWAADADSVRSLRLIDKIPESDDVTSFIFEARDGGPLSKFEPGQHLPIELEIPGIGDPVRRTYSLSGDPSQDRYRISVKREPKGLASGFLHDHVEPGTIINSRRPAGDFMMTCNECPLVLVSAGVGVTPMMAILHAVAAESSDRPVWFVHGARDGRHHPLAQEVRDLASEQPEVAVHVAYSRPDPGDRKGVNYDSRGRVDGALIARLVDNVDAHYFLCGPTKFMAAIQADLENRGVPLDQIHWETFGPAG